MSSNCSPVHQLPQMPVVVPPPPVAPATKPTSPTTDHKFSKRKEIQLNECQWATVYPDIQKACYLARVCTMFPPKECRLKNIQPILQEGPTCGFAALSMIFGGHPNPEQLLEMAKQKNYTRNGEMFSAINLFTLTDDIVNNQLGNQENEQNDNTDQIRTSIGKCRLYNGRLSTNDIKQLLKTGACLLVPYDPDFNHGPCLKNGHKAHWAVIIGYLIDSDNKFYVFARHGKTKNVAIWSLKLLSASNSNLNEFEQPKGYPDIEFILPAGGLGGLYGLKNKAIILEDLQIEEIIVK